MSSMLPIKGIRRIVPFRVPILWLIVIALVSFGPWLGLNAFWGRQVMLVCLLALVVSGLTISFGYAGELALGQVAVYAAGAYAGGWFAVYIFNDLLIAIVIGALAGVVLGLISGVPGLRIGGWMLGIASFFLVILIPDLVQLIPGLGGYEGLRGIPRPAMFGVELSAESFYIAVVLVTAAWFVIFRNLIRSRWGSGLLVLKQSPVLAESLGMSVYRTKLAAYAIGAIPAGIAGAMFAYLDGYIAPENFSLQMSISVLAACILGGLKSIYGVFAGVAVIQVLLTRTDVFENYAMVAFGALLILGGVAFSGGIAGFLNYLIRKSGLAAWYERWTRREEDTGEGGGDIDQVAGELLAVEGVSKLFGGNPALQDVSFTAEPGQITSLIGPNGSGKTTMLNCIGGYYTLDSGTIRMGDAVLSGKSADHVSRLGIARTFQTPAIPEDLSVLDVLLSARISVSRVSALAVALRLPSYWAAVYRDNEIVRNVLLATGLWSRRFETAADLSLGTRRVLELARVLVRQPSVILLDEVASGLDIDEVVELDAVLRRVRNAGATIVLVEHNFSLVRAISDRVVVLAEGRVIVDGTPDIVESDPQVRKHYLGENIEFSGTSLRKDES